MKSLTQPLKDEHKELFPHVERILIVAETVTAGNVPGLSGGLEEVYAFLADHLLAHAQAEEAALYPAVQGALRSPEATLTMARDHVEVKRYVEELAALKTGLAEQRLTKSQAADLKRVLYGLYALLKVHFAKEEEVYLPILDRSLTPETAQAMFEQMEEAASKARQAA